MRLHDGSTAEQQVKSVNVVLRLGDAHCHVLFPSDVLQSTVLLHGLVVKGVQLVVLFLHVA